MRHLTLIDTHCHLDFDQFSSDREAVLERAEKAGVNRIVIPGLDLPTSRAAIQLSASHAALYAAVGLHPTEAGSWTEETGAELRNLLKTSGTFRDSGELGNSKIVAIGEIGLDYYWDSAPHGIQQTALRSQLDLASETGLPVILHMRAARDIALGDCGADLLQILAAWVTLLRSTKNSLAERPGVLHSYSGTLEMARTAINLGFYIGVTGPITFDNARKRQEILSALPLEKILIETDAPFQAPEPYRGKRNEPAYVRLIADKIALLHKCSFEQVAEATSKNACRLFAWKENA